ncbi:hypothetical protein F5B20DRAFT_72350 [Whalleya microplaca]|nr:hypothetical protein F5B20DRAFT_72350 [Whalleya microplaca]
MKPILFPATILVAAASVGAQTTDPTSTTVVAEAVSSCAAQNILDACLASTTSYIALCTPDDYSCLCDKYVAIMTCFNNCPNDGRKPTYQQTKDLYCMNASIYGTTTTAKVATTTTKDTSKTKNAATTTEADHESADAGGSTRASSSTTVTASVNEAELLGGNAPGGMLAAFAGGLAAALL